MALSRITNYIEADGADLNLQSSDTTITDGSVLGVINFKAPSEASGTDSILLASKIEAVAEGTFSASSNATELVFFTASSEAAGTAGGGKMVMSSTGNLTLKDTRTADGSSPTITLQTGDTDIAQDDVLGTINFQAPDEGTGTDAILVAAGIAAISEGDFSSSSNATKLSFKTGASETAAEKMSLGSGGDLSIVTDGASIFFGADSEIELRHVADDGLIIKHVGTGDGKEPSLTFQAGDNDIAQDDILGQINFQAPDEGAGTDAVLIASTIKAFSEGDFSSSNNATTLELATGRSAAAGSDGGRIRLTSTGRLELKNQNTADDSFPVISLETGDTDIAQDDVLGRITFKAPDEGTGTDAILVAAAIEAVSEGDFSSSSNATKLSFKTGSSEAAAEKMSLSSVGQLKVQNEVDNNYIAEFQNTEATDGRSFGMRIKAGSNASDQSFVIQDHDASNTLFKITGDGDVNIGIGDILFGTSGKGINLGVTSNTDSNTLDDYEEGTWSGTLRAVAGSAGTVAGNTSDGHYLKVGNAVNIFFTCNLTNLGSYTANANVAVYGLPFTAGGYINHPLTLGFHDFHSNSTTRNIQVQVTANQAYVYHANPDSTITVWNDIGTGLYSHNGWYRTDF